MRLSCLYSFQGIRFHSCQDFGTFCPTEPAWGQTSSQRAVGDTWHAHGSDMQDYLALLPFCYRIVFEAFRYQTSPICPYCSGACDSGLHHLFTSPRRRNTSTLKAHQESLFVQQLLHRPSHLFRRACPSALQFSRTHINTLRTCQHRLCRKRRIVFLETKAGKVATQ